MKDKIKIEDLSNEAKDKMVEMLQGQANTPHCYSDKGANWEWKAENRYKYWNLAETLIRGIKNKEIGGK